jgi:hypothetical protein
MLIAMFTAAPCCFTFRASSIQSVYAHTISRLFEVFLMVLSGSQMEIPQTFG